MTSPRRESESRSTSFYHVSLLLCYSSLSDQLSAWDGRSWEELEGVGRVGGQGRSNAVSEWRQRADPRTHSCHTATHFTLLRIVSVFVEFLFFVFLFSRHFLRDKDSVCLDRPKGKVDFSPTRSGGILPEQSVCVCKYRYHTDYNPTAAVDG